ncbi:thiamine pyrophosphate-dependent dehydrogenase E1 component subunit alpha [Psychrobium sp. 1_MG-2023]|uniref:thiamine pyrophosphate-dependent dehydrogenase E1 component subunit alpha n=1 Tax=Psychrobium sp. 1_MG-2023 TaxID=3062624 RepID=UPI000C32648D|nr:thiamine pyrophosphate-dependent dehydrogenase E1 component subunit alpha [Psychrobium sp. 1_MG-2023]MDP2560618.1 thiamine pyrophosphate-dependent dehydrogenase E1 component subunit alpha [Psychrobium sp. 1_MG-2023]PKF57603.1 3-methyl-2-oxobutanoate dehydrogenase [Alteromonadales bacterium alter-6D02]
MNRPDQHVGAVIHQANFIAGNALEVPTLKVLAQDGSIYPNAALPEIDKDLALKIYDTMVFTRVLDERMVASQRQGRISFYMTCKGEEASIIGSAAALTDHDMIMAQYREHAALRYRGFTTANFMNQMFSNAKDLGKGRQMPIHYGSNELNYMTISSPLATQIPQATGYAYGQRLQGNQALTLCYFGEGAASEGDFHAGLNMAAVLKAPAIFYCRNNGYAISTSTDEQYAGDGIAPRGVGYGIETIRVDGNDCLAVLLATQEARKYALAHNKPVLIEAMSYRLGAHSTSDDPSGYRSKDEEELWAKIDGVQRFKLWLEQQGWWTEEQESERYQAYREEVLRELKVAEKIEPPSLQELVTDVYAEVPAHLSQQLEQLETHIAKYPSAYPSASKGAK